MAPRPSPTTLIQKSPHDEFVLLFQQQLSEAKKEKFEIYQRKQSNRRQFEKRKSVPEFAMLSEINSVEEDEVAAHRHRLSTLREENMSGLNLSKSNTLISVEEDKKLTKNTSNCSVTSINEHKQYNSYQNDKIKLTKNEQIILEDLNDTISPQHGCCYYFCCCCLFKVFRAKQENKQKLTDSEY